MPECAVYNQDVELQLAITRGIGSSNYIGQVLQNLAHGVASWPWFSLYSYAITNVSPSMSLFRG